MKISIHQPNFFIFSGVIEKLAASDIFVIMGQCQYEKSNYQNRFLLKDKWYTLSVNNKIEKIINKNYINVWKDWNKIKTKLPEYRKYLELFDSCINYNLLFCNTDIIYKICNLLNIKTKIVSDYPTELKKTERLIDICKHYNATKYLSGPSGKNYLDFSLFEKENIEVEIQDQTNISKISVLEYLKLRNIKC